MLHATKSCMSSPYFVYSISLIKSLITCFNHYLMYEFFWLSNRAQSGWPNFKPRKDNYKVECIVNALLIRSLTKLTSGFSGVALWERVACSRRVFPSHNLAQTSPGGLSCFFCSCKRPFYTIIFTGRIRIK